MWGQGKIIQAKAGTERHCDVCCFTRASLLLLYENAAAGA
jgi:hypothetical protein